MHDAELRDWRLEWFERLDVGSCHQLGAWHCVLG
jgi:hypothetical protein